MSDRDEVYSSASLEGPLFVYQLRCDGGRLAKGIDRHLFQMQRLRTRSATLTYTGTLDDSAEALANCTADWEAQCFDHVQPFLFQCHGY